MACNTSFQTNSGLENHAKDARHSAFLCACNTSFSRLSSLARHINSNTGSGYHCELCEDKTLPRVDKLYDHLRDGHKVSQRVLDRFKNKALDRTSRKASRQIQPAPARAPVTTTQVAPPGGFGAPWPPTGQVSGMAGRHAGNMGQLSPNGINPALTVRSLKCSHRSKTGIAHTRSRLTLMFPRFSLIPSPSNDLQIRHLSARKASVHESVFPFLSLNQLFLGVVERSSEAVFFLLAAV